MTDAPTTQELVERARGGDQEAYDSLFMRVGERLVLFIRLRLGPELRGRLEIEDVLQDTYVAAHSSFASFTSKGERDFTRWLFRLVENRIRDNVDHFAAKKRAPGKLVSGHKVLSNVLSSATGPSTACARSEEHERLATQLDALDASEREALLLRYFHELTLDEVAAAMSRSKSAVRRLLSRGVVRLGGLLERSGG